MHRFHPTQFLCVLLTLCLTACTGLAAPDGQPMGIAVADGDNRITWRMAENAIVFDVDSPRGIGRATVRLVAGTYPERVRLRFHLAGLEELRLAYDTTVVTLSTRPATQISAGCVRTRLVSDNELISAPLLSDASAP